MLGTIIAFANTGFYHCAHNYKLSMRYIHSLSEYVVHGQFKRGNSIFVEKIFITNMAI